MSEPDDAAWEVRLERMREAVRLWRVRVSDPESPQPGSPLAADDRDNPWKRLLGSQLAWWGLITAVEHLDAGVRLLDTQPAEGPILPAANFTVIRAASLGASSAVYLLGPKPRGDRVSHALQLAREEHRQVANFRKTVVEHPGLLAHVRDSVPTDFAASHQTAVVELTALLKARDTTDRIHDTDLIDRAAELVPGFKTDPLLAYAMATGWKLGSGSAHGRMLMSVQRGTSPVVQHEGVSYLLNQTTRADVIQYLTAVLLLLNEGWRLWDLRSRRNI